MVSYEGELVFNLNTEARILAVYSGEEAGAIPELIWDRNLYIGVKGLRIVLETGENLAGCKDAGIYVIDSTGATRIWLADEFRGSKIVYYLREGDIDVGGLWQIQSFVDFGSWRAFGDKVIISVEESLR